jgi:hypothetical protein
MKCSKCGSEKNVKRIKTLGEICFNCFTQQTSRMVIFRDHWIRNEIIPAIKQEISDEIMKNGESFDIASYIEQSTYDRDLIENAIDRMLWVETIPEIVRIALSRYKKVDFELEDDMESSTDAE